MSMAQEILFYMAIFLGLLLLLRFCLRFLRLCIRFLWGSGLLLLLNTIGIAGLSIGINPLTMGVAWLLGVPGICAMLLLKHLLPV